MTRPRRHGELRSNWKIIANFVEIYRAQLHPERISSTRVGALTVLRAAYAAMWQAYGAADTAARCRLRSA